MRCVVAAGLFVDPRSMLLFAGRDRKMGGMGNSSDPIDQRREPIVLVPVGVDEAALDACLSALDAATPAGTRIWLADDARAGPRAHAVIEGWLARTPLEAH